MKAFLVRALALTLCTMGLVGCSGSKPTIPADVPTGAPGGADLAPAKSASGQTQTQPLAEP